MQLQKEKEPEDQNDLPVLWGEGFVSDSYRKT